jgi:hypothetical protein
MIDEDPLKAECYQRSEERRPLGMNQSVSRPSRIFLNDWKHQHSTRRHTSTPPFENCVSTAKKACIRWAFDTHDVCL